MSLIYLHLNLLPAYIDAGTGSIIIQVVIGLLAGGAFALKMFWKRITGRFKRNSQANADGQQEDIVEK